MSRIDEEYRSEWERNDYWPSPKIQCPGCSGTMVTRDGSLWRCLTCSDMLEY